MPSNVGSHYLLEGLTPDGEIKEPARQAVMNELRSTVRPELLNRIDEIVMFAPLTLPQIERIVDLQVALLRGRLREHDVELELTEAARRHLAQAGYDPVHGAR